MFKISRKMERDFSKVYIRSLSEAAKMFLKISQNSKENTCARVSFLIKLQAWRTSLLQNTSEQLLFAYLKLHLITDIFIKVLSKYIILEYDILFGIT